jgi:hypothetical protein
MTLVNPSSLRAFSEAIQLIISIENRSGLLSFVRKDDIFELVFKIG